MEQDFFNAMDSWEVISLLVSFLVVVIAIYRWLMVRWQSDVNLKRYVFVHGVPERRLDGPFEMHLDVPIEQHVILSISKGEDLMRTVHDGTLTAGSHRIGVDCQGLETGPYSIMVTTEGQVDIKKFDWLGN
jgi:hypothetical protein